jgi:hypothetical protein
MICKGFNNTPRLCYYRSANFKLVNNMFIRFKSRNVIPKILGLCFKVIFHRL